MYSNPRVRKAFEALFLSAFSGFITWLSILPGEDGYYYGWDISSGNFGVLYDHLPPERILGAFIGVVYSAAYAFWCFWNVYKLSEGNKRKID